MKLVIQRVLKSSVIIDGNEKREITKGLNILLGVSENDTKKEVDYLVAKCLALRIFEDLDGKMNLSISDIKGEILIISNFTLCADCKKGNRPSFIKALKPSMSKELYEYFIFKLSESEINIKTGEFGADMQVEIINDGPVTIVMDTDVMLK